MPHENDDDSRKLTAIRGRADFRSLISSPRSQSLNGSPSIFPLTLSITFRIWSHIFLLQSLVFATQARPAAGGELMDFGVIYASYRVNFSNNVDRAPSSWQTKIPSRRQAKAYSQGKKRSRYMAQSQRSERRPIHSTIFTN